MPCITELFLQTITERPLKIPNGGQCISPVGICDTASGLWEKGTQRKPEVVPEPERVAPKGLVAVGKTKPQSTCQYNPYCIVSSHIDIQIFIAVSSTD